jgi:hypothetical protein
MEDLFWNSDGLGDSFKHCIIHEVVNEHKLDFFICQKWEGLILMHLFLNIYP